MVERLLPTLEINVLNKLYQKGKIKEKEAVNSPIEKNYKFMKAAKTNWISSLFQ